MEVDWAGYELHPETPSGGAPLSGVLPDADAMLGYVRSFAAGFGIRDLVPPRTLPNTRRAHAVARHARDAGRLHVFNAAAYDAYWRHGQGIESDEELAALARQASSRPIAPAWRATAWARRVEASRPGAAMSSIPNPAANARTRACMRSASGRTSERGTPPGGVSGCSSYPNQSTCTSSSRCSLTRLLRSATKQKGQTKSVK